MIQKLMTFVGLSKKKQLKVTFIFFQNGVFRKLYYQLYLLELTLKDFNEVILV